VGEGTSNTIANSSDGINWIGGGKSIFTTSGNGVVSNVQDNFSITLGSYGPGLSNKLDVVSDKYYNTGFTNMSITIKTS